MDNLQRPLSFVLLYLLSVAWMLRPAAAAELPSQSCQASSVAKSIVVGGIARTYLLRVPCNFHERRSALVVALHGRGGSGVLFETQSQLDEKADREGFALAYPDGLVDSYGTANWNYFYDPFYSNPPDDVGFLRAVIDSLQATLHPDARRIYVTGTSAGGYMAQRVGVELADRVAAIGVVEGNTYVVVPPFSPPSIPNPVAPVSVLLLKGDQDPNNYYCGANFAGAPPGFHVSSADEDFAYWTGPAANSCSRVDTSAPMCSSFGVVGTNGKIVFGQTTDVVKKIGRHCKDDTEVRIYRLIGGGDIWYQSPMNVPGQVPFNPDLNRHTGVTTNDILWNFFVEHPKSSEDRDHD